MAIVIAVVNQKGGCGKTTTSINLSAALSKHQRVLVIDLDPQSHTTIGLNVNPQSLKKSIFDVMDIRENKTNFKDIVLEVNDNFYLAPTNLYLTSLEQKLSGKKDRENRLKEELAAIEEDYDYVLIDCPPNFGLLTVNALLAAQYMVVPVETSTFSLEGLKRILEVAGMLERKVGHKIEMKFLVSIYDRRTSFARDFADNLAEKYPDQVFNTRIHRSVKYYESAKAGMPISRFRPGSVGSEDFRSLAQEIMSWVKQKKKSKIITADHDDHEVHGSTFVKTVEELKESYADAAEITGVEPVECGVKVKESVIKKNSISITNHKIIGEYKPDGYWKTAAPFGRRYH